MKLSNFLTEAKRGDRIYVIYDVSSKRVISTTQNPKKVVEMINNATKGGYTNSDLANVEMKGEDYFGSGAGKTIVYKTWIL